ncbi:MAG: porin [Nitrospirae bacterium]|nr:porin [Nitrospirota bacterium]
MKFGWFVFTILCLGFMLQGNALAGDTLADVLKEKGMITKEDWIRIQAAEEKKAEEAKNKLDEEFPVIAGWGGKGFTLETRDGLWKTAIQFRFQGRYSYSRRTDADSFSDFNADNESTFELRRVRMKIGGHAYQPWIKHYIEVNWQSTSNSGSSPGSTSLITWRFTLDKYQWAQLRIGQWKVNYNRERVDSSGKQQFIERSIVNTVFTLDRQIGAMLMGHLAPGTFADSWYYVGVFTGSGTGEANDDDNLMWLGRFQWNFLGRDLKFSQSDVEYHENPTASIAFGAFTNIGKCTRWSSSGCGTLGFPNAAGVAFTKDSVAANGQFRVQGMMEEFAFKWRGLSIQHEYHWKEVKDKSIPEGAAGHKTNLMGSYAQIGYFPHYLIPIIPKPLEIAFRYAFVDPNVSAKNDKLSAYTAAINWFFAGHRNKLTLDGTWFTLAQPVGKDLNEQQVRLQWDVSF